MIVWQGAEGRFGFQTHGLQGLEVMYANNSANGYTLDQVAKANNQLEEK